MNNQSPSKPSLLATTATPSLEISIERLGPAGIRNELNFLAQLPGDNRSDEERFADNSIRFFKIDARLSKSTPSLDRIAADFTEADCGSYLLSPKHVLYKVQCADGTFEIKRNAVGEMSLIQFECRATNPQDAYKKFSAAVFPVLDYFSYLTNTPLFLGTTRAEDKKNHRTMLAFVGPFPSAIIEAQAHKLSDSMRPVYAMYREARNASSEFYRFLCFYKILEGLLGSFRAKVRKEARANGITIKSTMELVPSCPGISDLLCPYVCKSIKKFLDDVLTPKFRNAMTHFETDDGIVLHTSC